MFKRFFLLIGINIGILISLNILLWIAERIFGFQISAAIGNQQGLIIFSVIFGFGGALTNLMISKRSAKRIYSLQNISESEGDHKLSLVYNTIRDIAFSHHIDMPEVTYYSSQEINAFATGASKNSSLVAVSTGLLESMNDKEIAAVVGHEMTHILNGDMVTTTLLQGSLNTFTTLFARIIGSIIDSALHSRDSDGNSGGIGYYMTVNILNALFGLLSGLIIMRYSRTREYKADEGSARLLSKDSMISALRRLGRHIDMNPVPRDGFATMKIFGGVSNFGELWMSHPPIEKRIAYLEGLNM